MNFTTTYRESLAGCNVRAWCQQVLAQCFGVVCDKVFALCVWLASGTCEREFALDVLSFTIGRVLAVFIGFSFVGILRFCGVARRRSCCIGAIQEERCKLCGSSGPRFWTVSSIPSSRPCFFVGKEMSSPDCLQDLCRSVEWSCNCVS